MEDSKVQFLIDDNPTTLVAGVNSTAIYDRIQERDEHLAKVEIGVLACIIILAVVGNTCVLAALRYRRKQVSRMHLLITHLCIADLMVAFLNVLPQMAWDITHRFRGGDFLCRAVKYAQVMPIYLSTYILVIIAIDRYRAICFPLSNYTWTSTKLNGMIAFSWVLSLAFSIPQAVIFRNREIVANSGVFDCWCVFHPEWTLKVYITASSALLYAIPFLIMLVLYGRICLVVWRNVRHSKLGNPCTSEPGEVVYKFNGTGQISVITKSRDAGSVIGRKPDPSCIVLPRRHQIRGFSRSKIKTIKLTFVVIVAFMICWAPHIVTQMWWAFDPNAPYSHSVFVICILLASLNSCCNPWIYMAFSGNLIRHILPCCHGNRLETRTEAASKTAMQLKQDGSKPAVGKPPECLDLQAGILGKSRRKTFPNSGTTSTKLTTSMKLRTNLPITDTERNHVLIAPKLSYKETKTCNCKLCTKYSNPPKVTSGKGRIKKREKEQYSPSDQGSHCMRRRIRLSYPYIFCKTFTGEHVELKHTTI